MRGALDIDQVVSIAVREVARDFPCVERDDLRQEAEIWLIENEPYVDWAKNMKYAATAASYLRGRLRRHLLGIAKAERAYQSGYEVRDQYEYSSKSLEMRGLIAECLRGIVTGTREPTKGEKQGPSNADPAESSMNFVVSMVDIEDGWATLNADDRRLLASFFVYDVPAATLAAEFGYTDRTVYNALKGALRRLCGPLNGVQ